MFFPPERCAGRGLRSTRLMGRERGVRLATTARGNALKEIKPWQGDGSAIRFGFCAFRGKVWVDGDEANVDYGEFRQY